MPVRGLRAVGFVRGVEHRERLLEEGNRLVVLAGARECIAETLQRLRDLDGVAMPSA